MPLDGSLDFQMVSFSGPNPKLSELKINDEDIKFALFTLAEQIAIQDYANKVVTLAP